MKKKLLSTQDILLMFIILLCVCISGCDSERENFLGSMTVQLALKDGLGDISLENIPVVITNLEDNSVREEASSNAGIAEFTDIPSGVYTISISASREEGEYILSGSASNVLVEMGQNTYISISIDAMNPSADLVIKEVYYAGTTQPVYFKDQFIEIFNNSSEVIYADGLYIAHLLMHSTWNATVPYNQFLDLEENVYADYIEQVPGNGTDYPIDPGKSIVIALNAMDFKEDNPQPERALNMTNADFERYAVTWLESQGRIPNYTFDFDNPDVTNMQPIFLSTNGYNPSFFMMYIAGPSMVIFRRDEAFTQDDLVLYQYTNASGTPTEVEIMKIPVSSILDGVDFMDHAEEGDWKRLPTSIDASFNYLRPDGRASYSFMSLRRRIDQQASARFGRVVLQTTMNSFADFEAITPPDPRGYDHNPFKK
jgi:hypothetical protein